MRLGIDVADQIADLVTAIANKKQAPHKPLGDNGSRGKANKYVIK